MSEYIRWLSELNKSSGPIAGGKGANLAEMYNSKFPVPPAFVVTTKGYYFFIEKTRLKEKITEILDSIDVDDTQELEDKAKKIRKMMVDAEMPSELEAEIIEAYEDLSIDKKALETASKFAAQILKNSSEVTFVAVRSSATTEDLAESSFAGQQETYLNIKGNRDLIEAVKKVFASLFTARAIYYRKKRGFSAEKFSLAAVVQKMIDSQKSGVMFSRNPIKNDNNIMIEAVFGLGEGIVSGTIKPDNYIVSRDLKILEKKISEKKIALTRSSQGDTETVTLTKEKSAEQVLTEGEIQKLADYAIKLEEHYNKPQDIEFALEKREIYIVQTRPITTQTQENTKQKIEGKLLLSGLGASPGVISGKVKIIHDLNELAKIQKGDILVTEMTNPDMVVTMQKSSAIITNEGGITSHAAIVSREMGIPAVVGTNTATKSLKDGQIITVDGFNGKVYEGTAQEQKVEIKKIVPTQTKIKVILDLPDFADRAALSGCEAVGLLRLEGIIASSGKHPLKFVKENKIEDYVKVIQSGVEKIAEHFKEIWIRTSDIRSDEFMHLDGAPQQPELNPMLGMHGIRFSLKNPKILAAELTAIKNAADKFPNKKFGVMIPQVISTEEIIQTKELAKQLSVNNIKIGIMVETPAACFIIRHLLDVGIDFISFGTNDLTQYVLAIDRGNEQVQYLYNEMHPAVLNALKRVLRTCQEYGVESSICGQAGSKREMAEFLVKNSISSISVNADAAYDVSVLVAELEKQIISNPNQKFSKSNSKSNKKQEDEDVQAIEDNHEEAKISNSKEPQEEIETEQAAEQTIPAEPETPAYIAEQVAEQLVTEQVAKEQIEKQVIEEIIAEPISNSEPEPNEPEPEPTPEPKDDEPEPDYEPEPEEDKSVLNIF